jgi:UDP-glucose 4-epimerase
VDFPIQLGPRRPGDSPHLVADSTRIRQVLGWTPRWDDLNQIVASALAWERRLGPDGPRPVD